MMKPAVAPKHILSVFTADEIRSKMFSMAIGLNSRLSGCVQNEHPNGLVFQARELHDEIEKVRSDLDILQNLCNEVIRAGDDTVGPLDPKDSDPIGILCQHDLPINSCQACDE